MKDKDKVKVKLLKYHGYYSDSEGLQQERAEETDWEDIAPEDCDIIRKWIITENKRLLQYNNYDNCHKEGYVLLTPIPIKEKQTIQNIIKEGKQREKEEAEKAKKKAKADAKRKATLEQKKKDKELKKLAELKARYESDD